MRLILVFLPLFLSVILLQLSTGGVGPLDALSGLANGFSATEVGLLGSAHFFGFFIGCWWAPRLMGRVGHSRSFAAFTTVGAIGLLAHFLVINPYAWAVMRVGSGLCVAGCYTVIEAWLQARLTNRIRGRAMGIYRIVDMGASLAAQLAITVLEPNSYVSYNLLALICCAAILPLLLTRAIPPHTPAAPRLRPMLAVMCSPLATAGVVVAALGSASFRMVGPVYGIEMGLRVDQIAWFLAAFVFGGAVVQYPVGWLADKYDRRWVLIGLSGAAILSCGSMIMLSQTSTAALMTLACLFGITTFPVFSVASAHAHDFAHSNERVELSAALLFFYALGAIAAPYLASGLMQWFAPEALFVMISAGHVVLILLGVYRMRRRPTQDRRTAYVYAPRTSFIVGRLMKRLREPPG